MIAEKPTGGMEFFSAADGRVDPLDSGSLNSVFKLFACIPRTG